MPGCKQTPWIVKSSLPVLNYFHNLVIKVHDTYITCKSVQILKVNFCHVAFLNNRGGVIRI
ncbi:hypothetical protein NIES267_08540 [Calothrix parasitica NIES-267]|uniref:Uncharacterized protein n=1 Tax=Calothrix parasitica NIES-267 TaxID=1973488 RepID=A0A1Z4LJV4_9CYAN|nr:hypothetical protein NIES267_08540 [Calothrix parasitica NIES-267]